MVFLNYIKDCHDASTDAGEVATANRPDIGFYEGSATYLAIPASEDFDTIEDYTFTGCTALEDVYIPANVTSIGAKAFSGCTALKTITICRAKATSSMTKKKPFGAPATCQIIFDKTAKPKTEQTT